MKLIYKNCDCLDVAFRGALPESILNVLAAAKQKAQEQKKPVYITLPGFAAPVKVAEAGKKGGFSYTVDMGVDGEEIWWFAHSTNPSLWNISVSVKSLAFVLYGYQGVKRRMHERLAALGAFGNFEMPDETTGEVKEVLLESISRFDFCADYILDGFDPAAQVFVLHHRSTKRKRPEVNVEIVERGNATESILIGKMPNRQIAVYNKIKEITVKKKHYWWEAWGLDQKIFTGDIWRVEIRAGKKELKKWEATNFAALETHIANIVASILQSIRLALPCTNDTNKSRWPTHPLWIETEEAAARTLAEYATTASKERIVALKYDELLQSYESMLEGTLLNYAVARGEGFERIGLVADRIVNNLKNKITLHPARYEAKEEDLKAKFRHKAGGG